MERESKLGTRELVYFGCIFKKQSKPEWCWVLSAHENKGRKQSFVREYYSEKHFWNLLQRSHHCICRIPRRKLLWAWMIARILCEQFTLKNCGKFFTTKKCSFRIRSFRLFLRVYLRQIWILDYFSRKIELFQNLPNNPKSKKVCLNMFRENVFRNFMKYDWTDLLNYPNTKVKEVGL